MDVFSVISALFAVASFNTSTVNAPNLVSNFDGDGAVLTCRTTTINKPNQNGTLAAFTKDPASEKALLSLGWNPDVEQPLWAFEGAAIVSGVAGAVDEAGRQKLLKQSVVWLHQSDNIGKPTVKPTAKISSWLTQDGETSSTFPYLKSYRQHFQYCTTK